MDELIEAVKQMAKKCRLQNWEQISDKNGAIGAVRMIAEEYICLVERRKEPE